MSGLRIRSFRPGQVTQWLACGWRLWRRRPLEAVLPAAVFALAVLVLRAIPVLGDIVLLLLLPSVLTSYVLHVHVIALTGTAPRAIRSGGAAGLSALGAGAAPCAVRCLVKNREYLSADPGRPGAGGARACHSCLVQPGRRAGGGQPLWILRAQPRADDPAAAGLWSRRAAVDRGHGAVAMDPAAVCAARHGAAGCGRLECAGASSAMPRRCC